jgi:hypothetical protein
MELTLNLTPGQLARALEPLATTWRDSERDPALRGAGYLRCLTSGTPPTLYLELQPQGRGPQIRWTLTLSPCDSARTAVRASWRVTPLTVVSYATFFAAIFYLYNFDGLRRSPVSSFGFQAGAYLLFAGFMVASSVRRARHQASIIADILERTRPVHSGSAQGAAT